MLVPDRHFEWVANMWVACMKCHDSRQSRLHK